MPAIPGDQFSCLCVISRAPLSTNLPPGGAIVRRGHRRPNGALSNLTSPKTIAIFDDVHTSASSSPARFDGPPMEREERGQSVEIGFKKAAINGR